MDVVARAVTSRQENNNTDGKAGEFVKEKGSDTTSILIPWCSTRFEIVTLAQWSYRNGVISSLKNTTFTPLYQSSLSFIKGRVNDFVKLFSSIAWFTRARIMLRDDIVLNVVFLRSVEIAKVILAILYVSFSIYFVFLFTLRYLFYVISLIVWSLKKPSLHKVRLTLQRFVIFLNYQQWDLS